LFRHSVDIGGYPRLSALKIALRPRSDDDLPFLRHLYISIRLAEFAAAPWPDPVKQAFLHDQFRLQDHHYTTHYAGITFAIIERGGQPVGRLYLSRGEADLRVVDISLLTGHRGLGIGTALLRSVIDEAAAEEKSVSLHVDKTNPAQRLYRRLGFVPVEHPAEQSNGLYDKMIWKP